MFFEFNVSADIDLGEAAGFQILFNIMSTVHSARNLLSMQAQKPRRWSWYLATDTENAVSREWNPRKRRSLLTIRDEEFGKAAKNMQDVPTHVIDLRVCLVDPQILHWEITESSFGLPEECNSSHDTTMIIKKIDGEFWILLQVQFLPTSSSTWPRKQNDSRSNISADRAKSVIDRSKKTRHRLVDIVNGLVVPWIDVWTVPVVRQQLTPEDARIAAR